MTHCWEEPWKDPSQSQSSQCRLDLPEPHPDPIGVLPLNTGNSDPVEVEAEMGGQ